MGYHCGCYKQMMASFLALIVVIGCFVAWEDDNLILKSSLNQATTYTAKYLYFYTGTNTTATSTSNNTNTNTSATLNRNSTIAPSSPDILTNSPTNTIHASTPATPTTTTTNTTTSTSIGPRTCQRKCKNYPNKVLFSTRDEAGLNDRLFLIHHAMNMAAYLCAEFYLETPRDCLIRKHNRYNKVPSATTWSDLMDFQPLGREETDPPIYIEMSKQDQRNMFKKAPGNQWIKAVTSDRNLLIDTFERMEKISFDENKNYTQQGFMWVIHVNLWGVTDRIATYFANRITGPEGRRKMKKKNRKKKSTTNRKKNSTALPLWPWASTEMAHDYYQDLTDKYQYHSLIDKSGGCPYTELRTPSHIKELINNVWSNILASSKNNTVYGTLHLRRGDTQSGHNSCSTSLSTVSRYLKCSLDGVKEQLGKNIALLLMSDEKDQGYRDDIKNITENILGAQFFDADALLMEELRLKAQKDSIVKERRMHNYYLYAGVTHFGAKADFNLDRRRKIKCAKCDPVLKTLQTQQKKY